MFPLSPNCPSSPSSTFHPAAGIAILRGVKFRKISIIGVGLLGGSLGLAVRRGGLADEVAGYVRRDATA